MKVTSSN